MSMIIPKDQEGGTTLTVGSDSPAIYSKESLKICGTCTENPGAAEPQTCIVRNACGQIVSDGGTAIKQSGVASEHWGA